jgi:hypothetical protein
VQKADTILQGELIDFDNLLQTQQEVGQLSQQPFSNNISIYIYIYNRQWAVCMWDTYDSNHQPHHQGNEHLANDPSHGS